ncbi:MAG: hypothetical protein WD471_01650 [Candidatus Paceibacterota bacterium]
MLTYTKKTIHERWDSMPMKLREAMFSPAYGETLFEILEENHISKHKAETIIRLVGYVFFGLVHPDELDKKISQELDIDKKIISQITEGIDRKIFSQLRDEIMGMYSPVSDGSFEYKEPPLKPQDNENESSEELQDKNNEVEMTKEQKDREKRIEEQLKGKTTTPPEEKQINTTPDIEPKEKAEEKIPIKTTKDSTPSEKTEKKSITDEPIKNDNPSKGEESPAPFVIHEESSFSKPKGEKTDQRKSFSFSLGKFFSEDEKKNEKETPTATIGGSGIEKESDKSKKRTVHYSEHTTPVSEESKSFINMDRFTPKSENNVPSSELKKKDYKEDVVKPENKDKTKNTNTKSDGPSLRGNTVDLKSNSDD